MSVQAVANSPAILSFPAVIPTAIQTPSVASPSYQTSVRNMKLQLAAAAPIFLETPTERFLNAHPFEKILPVLQKMHANERDLALFDKLIDQENEQLLGYHAGSSTVRLFQDVVALIVKEILDIPVKDDFVFLRVPGDTSYRYEHALDFIRDWGPGTHDTQENIRKQILSINMNLYQSFDAAYDLTPSYYLENRTHTHANVREILKPFFSQLGIEGEAVNALWDQALNLLPHDKGYILQIFDPTRGFTFARQHSYLAHSGGKPNPKYRYHEILFDSTAIDFPQMRLVMSNKSTLNPFSPLIIKRYDGLTDEQRDQYEKSLTSLLKELPFDPEKIQKVKKDLLQLWTL